MPSNSKFGYLIKSCFIAKKGWLMWGADFAALEDKIMAIRSQDPNRIKIYSAGFDGHCVRAYSYWPECFPEIDPEDPKSVNSIKVKYKKKRSKSKAPSFALQYGGTHFTLIINCGFTEEEAKAIEKRYHELYSKTDEYNENIIQFACNNGYIELAFGLRLRTPLLHKVVPGTKTTPYAAQKEGRSAANASIQSWGMLINRTFIALDRRINESPYRLDILTMNTIHDALYGLVRIDNPAAVHFLNIALIEEMQWQEHPAIQSDEVKMGASLELGLSWDKLHELKNNASLEEVKEFINDHFKQ